MGLERYNASSLLINLRLLDMHDIIQLLSPYLSEVLTALVTLFVSWIHRLASKRSIIDRVTKIMRDHRVPSHVQDKVVASIFNLTDKKGGS